MTVESQIKTYIIGRTKWTQWVLNFKKHMKLGERSGDRARGEVGGQEVDEWISSRHSLFIDEH